MRCVVVLCWCVVVGVCAWLCSVVLFVVIARAQCGMLLCVCFVLFRYVYLRLPCCVLFVCDGLSCLCLVV